MKDRLKKKLYELRERAAHRFTVLAIRTVARAYGVKLPNVKPGSHLILQSKLYCVTFSPRKLDPKNLQALGWQHLN